MAADLSATAFVGRGLVVIATAVSASANAATKTDF
jgi:hypothetical protein